MITIEKKFSSFGYKARVTNARQLGEDNIEGAEPIETYELLNLEKPFDNKPYFSTPNVNE